MRKNLIMSVAVVLLAIVGASNANAQNVVQKGSSLVNVGLGITNNLLPIYGAYDYGIADNLWDENSAFTLGAGAGLYLGNGFGGFFVGPRAALHYHFVPQLDTYFSLMLGYHNYTVQSTKVTIAGETTKIGGASVGGFAWGTHLGARYMFTPKVGAYAEVGYGYSYLNLGVTFRL